MPRQYWDETLAWATADGAAVDNTTTEEIIFPNITVPANFMADGRLLRLRAFGRISTTGTPTMVWAIRWGGVGGTVIATTETMTMGSGITNLTWSLEALIQVRSNGSTGSVFTMGEVTVHTSASATLSQVFGSAGSDTPAAVTVDLTADTALSLTADWSAASASNTLTGHIYSLEAMN